MISCIFSQFGASKRVAHEADAQKIEKCVFQALDHVRRQLGHFHFFKLLTNQANRSAGFKAHVKVFPAVADPKATPAGSFALRLDEITKLVSALRGVLLELVSSPGKSDALQERCEAAIVIARLKPDGIKASFLKPFDKKAKGP